MIATLEHPPQVRALDRIGVTVRDRGVPGEVAITATIGLTLEGSTEKRHTCLTAIALRDVLTVLTFAGRHIAFRLTAEEDDDRG